MGPDDGLAAIGACRGGRCQGANSDRRLDPTPISTMSAGCSQLAGHGRFRTSNAYSYPREEIESFQQKQQFTPVPPAVHRIRQRPPADQPAYRDCGSWPRGRSYRVRGYGCGRTDAGFGVTPCMFPSIQFARPDLTWEFRCRSATCQVDAKADVEPGGAGRHLRCRRTSRLPGCGGSSRAPERTSLSRRYDRCHLAIAGRARLQAGTVTVFPLCLPSKRARMRNPGHPGLPCWPHRKQPESTP